MSLTVRFLGTSASRPTVERNVTAIAMIREGETPARGVFMSTVGDKFAVLENTGETIKQRSCFMPTLREALVDFYEQKAEWVQ